MASQPNGKRAYFGALKRTEAKNMRESTERWLNVEVRVLGNANHQLGRCLIYTD